MAASTLLMMVAVMVMPEEEEMRQTHGETRMLVSGMNRGMVARRALQPAVGSEPSPIWRWGELARTE